MAPPHFPLEKAVFEPSFDCPPTNPTSQGFGLQTTGMDCGSSTKEKNFFWTDTQCLTQQQEVWRTKLRKASPGSETTAKALPREVSWETACCWLWGPTPATATTLNSAATFVILSLCSSPSKFKLGHISPISQVLDAYAPAARERGAGGIGLGRQALQEPLKWQGGALPRLTPCFLIANPNFPLLSQRTLLGSAKFHRLEIEHTAHVYS